MNFSPKIIAVALLALLIGGGLWWWSDSQPSASSSASSDATDQTYRPRPAGSVTFNRDIAPILFQNCSVCHRPDQSAPFPLLNYADARKHAEAIAQVTQSRYMPPWLPETDEVHFEHERKLTADQIGLIQQWVKEGTPDGNPTDLPALPTWNSDWQIGPPDLIVQMPEAYELPAEGKDVYRQFVIPVKLAEGRFVEAVEIRPGNPRIVHHGVLFADRTPNSRELDAQDAAPGYGGGMALANAQLPDSQFIGWTPGKVPYRAPAGMAWRLELGMDLVLQLHMRPIGKPEKIQASIGLYFARQPPTRPAYALVLRNKQIDIPAGQADYAVVDTYDLPVDVEVFGVYPHAHYLATEMVAKAKLPDGRIQPLLHIRQWDFDWQDEYRYAQPFVLPKGTTIAFRYVFDNSSANIRNPHSLPQRVTYGPNSTNEMAELLLQVSPRDPNDLAVLGRYSALRAVAAEIQLNLARLEKNPDDPAEHRAIARRYLQINEPAEAARHLREAVRLEPAQGRNHYLLGDALANAGLLDEALTAFREALRLEPEQPLPYDAIARVLVIHPNPALRNPSEALVLAQRAVGLSQRKDVTLLETLMQVHLSLGQVAEAKRVAAEAMELARSTGNAEVAEAFRRQLEQMR